MKGVVHCGYVMIVELIVCRTICRNYDQQEGAAMGSPVSGVIVTLYVEEFEEQALVSAPYTPTIWKRYGLHLHDLKSGQS